MTKDDNILEERITTLEDNFNDLCDKLSELNIKQMVDFDEFKINGNNSLDEDEDEDGSDLIDGDEDGKLEY